MKRLAIVLIFTFVLSCLLTFSAAGVELPDHIKKNYKCVIVFEDKVLEGKVLEIKGGWLKFKPKKKKKPIYINIDRISYIREE